jgi:hypothetical protein
MVHCQTFANSGYRKISYDNPSERIGDENGSLPNICKLVIQENIKRNTPNERIGDEKGSLPNVSKFEIQQNVNEIEILLQYGRTSGNKLYS